MGIPLFFKFLKDSINTVIIKKGHISKYSSVSIDLNSLLHQAFSKIYMIDILSKIKELLKIGKKLNDKSLIEEAKRLEKQYQEGERLILEGEKLMNEGKIQGKYKIRDGNNLKNEKFYMRREGLSEDLIEKYEQDYHAKVWELI